MKGLHLSPYFSSDHYCIHCEGVSDFYSNIMLGLDQGLEEHQAEALAFPEYEAAPSQIYLKSHHHS